MWTPKEMGYFLMCTPINGGHLVCKNAIPSPNKICMKRVQICHLYVKFDIKVEKRGSLGVRTIDRV